MSNRKAIEFLLQLKSTKAHGKNYIKVTPHLVRHRLCNRLFFWACNDCKEYAIVTLYDFSCNLCRNVGTRNLLQVAEVCNLVQLAMVSKQSMESLQKVDPSSTLCNRCKPKILPDKLQRGHVTRCNLLATCLVYDQNFSTWAWVVTLSRLPPYEHVLPLPTTFLSSFSWDSLMTPNPSTTPAPTSLNKNLDRTPYNAIAKKIIPCNTRCSARFYFLQRLQRSFETSASCSLRFQVFF